MTVRLAISGVLYLWIGLIGCNPCFRDRHLLAAFRVLGVRSEPLTPAAGQTVALSLVSADVRPRDVQVAWYLCPALLPTPEPDDPRRSDRRRYLDAGSDGGSDLDAGFESTIEPDALPASDASSDGGAATTINECLSRQPFGTGLTANLHMPDDGGFEEVTREGSRRAVDVVGFACAGGAIGAPIERSSSPTCKGANAQGMVFVHRVYGPRTEHGAQPSAHPTIVEVRFGTKQSTAAIEVDHPPVVPRCVSRGKCPRYRFDVVFREDASHSSGGSWVNYVISDATPESDYGFFGLLPAYCPYLNIPRDSDEDDEESREPDSDDDESTSDGPSRDPNKAPRDLNPGDGSTSHGWAWMAPERPGTVRLFVYVINREGGFAWTERRVVVE